MVLFPRRPCHKKSGHAKEQVDDVVQDGHLEDAQQQGVGRGPGHSQSRVVRGDAGNEPEDADEQEDCPYGLGGPLQPGPCTGRAAHGGHGDYSFKWNWVERIVNGAFRKPVFGGA